MGRSALGAPDLFRSWRVTRGLLTLPRGAIVWSSFEARKMARDRAIAARTRNIGVNTPRWVRARTAITHGACVLVLLGGVCGCQDRVSMDPANPQQGIAAKMLVPSAIEVQRYLTKPIRFKGEGPPDGIEVILAARDAQGEEMKVIGSFFFELHKIRHASGDRLGDQISAWEVKVDTPDALGQYWDRFTRYYRFPLQLQGGTLAPGGYIMAVRFASPWGEKLFAEYEFTQEGAAAGRRSTKK